MLKMPTIQRLKIVLQSGIIKIKYIKLDNTISAISWMNVTNQKNVTYKRKRYIPNGPMNLTYAPSSSQAFVAMMNVFTSIGPGMSYKNVKTSHTRIQKIITRVGPCKISQIYIMVLQQLPPFLNLLRQPTKKLKNKLKKQCQKVKMSKSLNRLPSRKPQSRLLPKKKRVAYNLKKQIPQTNKLLLYKKR